MSQTPRNSYEFGLLMLSRSSDAGEQSAIVSRSGTVTHKVFARMMSSFALHLRRAGVTRGSLVAVGVGEVTAHLALRCAVALLGATSVQASTVVFALRGLQVTHYIYLTNSGLPKGVKSVQLTKAWMRPPLGLTAEEAAPFPGYVGPGATAILLESAWQNGPVLMPLTALALVRRLKKAMNGLGAQNLTTHILPAVGSGAFFHCASAILLARGALTNGLTVENVWNAGVEQIVGSAAQIVDFARYANDLPTDSRIARAHILGNAALPATHQSTVLEVFDVVRRSFDLPEAGFGICEQQIETLEDCNLIGGVIGPGYMIEVVDENRRTLPPGRSGVLRLRSDCMTAPYVGRLDLWKQSMSDGWFYPGLRARSLHQRKIEILGAIAAPLRIADQATGLSSIQDAHHMTAAATK